MDHLKPIRVLIAKVNEILVKHGFEPRTSSIYPNLEPDKPDFLQLLAAYKPGPKELQDRDDELAAQFEEVMKGFGKTDPNKKKIRDARKEIEDWL